MKVKSDHRSKFSTLANGRNKPEKKYQGFKVEALIFFRLLPSNYLNWKIYCDDHSSLSIVKLFGLKLITLKVKICCAVYIIMAWGAKTLLETHRGIIFAPHVNTRTVKGEMELR